MAQEEQKMRERAHHLWEQAEQPHDPTHPRRIFHQVDRLGVPFVIMGHTTPPRDPEEDEEDEGTRNAPKAGRARAGRRLAGLPE